MEKRVKKNVNEKMKKVSGNTQDEAMTRLAQEAARIAIYGLPVYDKSVEQEGDHWVGTLYYIENGLGV
jgi:hypothetical protein